ncbi:MAG: hypothetical protein EPN47_19535 [Acidobacteria bacterium]|nr:MAG: hypothetical protein EPN47_19535 [Acidobacteriota bacterium]
MGLLHGKTRWKNHQPALERMTKAAGVMMALAVFAACGSVKAQTSASQVSDITGDYQFLEPYNTLAILQEDQMLKGYIDVLQGQSESDAILSYPITIGERKGNHVEFRTRKIHEMYYRFSGAVQRGKGNKKDDPDYLELVGELQTVKTNSVTDQEAVDRRQVVLKFKGKNSGGS